MFNKQNFCHVASNNRNEKKAGIFVYKTTDDLATVSVSGYFNEKIVDINLHDLIIHEWHDATDRTKVQKNVLCVTERTLDNVGTVVIKTKWEEDTDQAIADLQEYVDNTFVRKDGTSVMTGPLKFRAGSFVGAIAGGLGDGISVYKLKSDNTIDSEVASLTETNGFVPGTTNTINIGSNSLKWKDAYFGGKLYVSTINNGADLTVPTTGGTIATTGNTVTLDSDQTITGLKTIEDNRFNLVQTSVTKGTNPSTNTYWAIQANDVSNSSTWADTRIGAIAWGLMTDGTSSAQLAATQNVAGSNEQALVEAVIESNGTKYGKAPTPAASSSTSEEKIATTGWVNDATKSTNVVHRSGDETIAGIKTISDSLAFCYGSTTTHEGFLYKTSAGSIALGIRTSDNSAWLADITFTTSGGIGISPATGQSVTAPESDVINSIVTTANKTKGQNGYFKLGNGLIVQWGIVTGATAGQTAIVNLPTAFSSASSYGVSVMNISATLGQAAVLNDIYSTNFHILTPNTSFYWVAIGY